MRQAGLIRSTRDRWPTALEAGHGFARAALITGMSGLLQACSGAPSRNILGSYFPSWMVCALVALVLTIIVRGVFVRTGIDAVLPAPLVAYLGLFAAFTFAVWLIWLA
jgi:hypothetical protein